MDIACLKIIMSRAIKTTGTVIVSSYLVQDVLKVHKIKIFFGFDFEICIISLLVMWKY